MVCRGVGEVPSGFWVFLTGVALAEVDDEPALLFAGVIAGFLVLAAAGLEAALTVFFTDVASVDEETGFCVAAEDSIGLVDVDEDATFSFFGTLLTGVAAVPGASDVAVVGFFAGVTVAAFVVFAVD